MDTIMLYKHLQMFWTVNTYIDTSNLEKKNPENLYYLHSLYTDTLTSSNNPIDKSIK
jgi:hypothetical protein